MPDERFDLEKLPADTTAAEAAELRPHYPGPAGYGSSMSYGYYNYGAEDKIHLRQLWRIAKKRKWMILTLALIVTTIVAIDVYRTKSTFEATTVIEIGKEATSLAAHGGLVLQDDYDPFYQVNIKTKLLSLTSPAVMEDVVAKLRLDENPKFMDLGRKSYSEALVAIKDRLIPVGQTAAEPAPETLDVIVQQSDAGVPRTPEESTRLKPYTAIVRAGLIVMPIRDTRAVRISYTHTDPKIAAAVANAIAESFLDRSFENKTEKYTRTAKWLDTSTRELKAKVERAEQALATYTRENNIFSTDGKDQTLTTDKLTRLHEQSMRAEAERMVKQSLYEEVKAGRVAQLPEAFADIVYKSVPKVAQLQAELSELEKTAAELSVKYGPDNPKVVEVQKKLNITREQINASRIGLEEKLKNDYERSVRDDEWFKAALERAKSEAVQQNQAAIQLNILKQDVETAKTLYTDFLQKTNQANIQVAEQSNNMKLIEPAEVPASPVGPKRFRSITLAFFLGIAAAFGLAFFLEYLDNTIKTVEDVNRYAQLPALSVIPAIAGSAPRRLSARKKALGGNGSELAMGNGGGQTTQLVSLDSRSSAAEAYRVLRTSVLLSAAGNPPKMVLVTSGQPGEGKTTTTVNTAISLAQLGASVLLIDCDLRKPTIHKVLGVDHAQGLSTYLSRNVEIDGLIQKLQIPNLSLLASGPIPPNPAELISSEKMKAMLRELAGRYDHILIDSPPLINVTDPVILSTMVDGVILVVHGGKSTRDVVRRARQELASVGAKIFGVVLNNVDLHRDGYDYYYYNRYYSGYGQEAEEKSGQSNAG